MAGQQERREPEDPRYVNLRQEWEVRYWCDKWHASREELERAVGMVGTAAEIVRAQIKLIRLLNPAGAVR
jgi:hypothetical protein